MKIRNKLIVAFGFYFIFTAIVSFLVYKELVIPSSNLTMMHSPSMTPTFREIEKTALEGTISHAKKLLLFGIMAILLSGAAISLQLAKSIEMPIKRLKTSAKKIAMGDFSTEIDIRGNDAIASLSRSIDSMQIILNNVLQSLDDSLKALREKQPRLLRAKKSAAIGTFASGVAHEISNPLAAVLTFSNLMLEIMPDDDPRRELLMIMSRETVRGDIVRQVLTFATDATINLSNFRLESRIVLL